MLKSKYRDEMRRFLPGKAGNRMKKILALLLVLLLLMAALTGCGKKTEEVTDPVTVVIPDEPLNEEKTPEAEVVYYGTVNTANTGVNIRGTPSSDGIVVGTAGIGETLKVLEQGEWCKVEFKDGVGYIYGELLDITEGEPEPETTAPENGDGTSPEGNDVITRVVNTEE